MFVLPVSEKHYYTDLVNENTSNKTILEFSTEDNVFELVLGSSSKSMGNNCQNSIDDIDPWLEYANFIDVNNIYGNGTDKRYKFERKLKVRYDNWGIYRKLFTEVKHNEKWFGIFDGTYFSVAYEAIYDVKNGDFGYTTHYPSFNFATSPNYQGTGYYEYFSDNKEIIHYRGTKCLKAFDLKAWCWMRNRKTLNPYRVPTSGYLQIREGY